MFGEAVSKNVFIWIPSWSTKLQPSVAATQSAAGIKDLQINSFFDKRRQWIHHFFWLWRMNNRKLSITKIKLPCTTWMQMRTSFYLCLIVFPPCLYICFFFFAIIVQVAREVSSYSILKAIYFKKTLLQNEIFRDNALFFANILLQIHSQRSIPDICQFWYTTELYLFMPVKVHQKVRNFATK